MASHLVCDKEV